MRLQRMRLASLALLALAPWPGAHVTPAAAVADEVLPNDNRHAAGTRRGNVLRVVLEARRGSWRPNLDADSAVTVFAFAEANAAPRIPGPLLRAAEGTEVRVTLRNRLPDSTLVVHGLRAGTVPDDTVQLAPGAVREVAFVAGAPGTYLYWGTTTGSPVNDRPLRDSQLTGAIVVDPRGVRPDTAERIFVITVLDLFPGDTVRNPRREDLFDRAINGRSWPHGEPLQYAVGDTVRWRWVNGSYLPHPMHLHGFHFRVTARGERNADTTYAPDRQRTVVTELMVAGSTFRMEWVPTRAGNWLMHCHMRPHVTPFPERADSVRRHEGHDVADHPRRAMQGLVLGVTTVERTARPAAAAPVATRRLRLFAQRAGAAPGRPAASGFVLQRDAEPRPDSVEVPGTPLVLVRGETAAITVVNRHPQPTSVHWHGMELESVFDGVSGWSRTGGSVAPLLATGDSLVVTLTPPRAGTFIYHTHMDEEDQLATGMYGPLLVLAPGERWDPDLDRVFLFGTAVDGDSIRIAINGRHAPPPIELRAGTAYRFRLVNIHSAAPAVVALVRDSTPLSWRPVAKDGADLLPALRAETRARFGRFGAGETWDVAWTPDRPMDAALVLTYEGQSIRQPIHVR